MIEKIFLLHHTHVDLGYTDDRDKVDADLIAMVDGVTDLVAASPAAPEEGRFRWIHELSWPVLEYLRRGGARREELFNQIRAGDVELTALHMHPTDLMDREVLEVSIDYACQLAAAENLPLTTAMFSDCPGIAWSVVDLLSQRGVRHLSAAPNVIMSMPLQVERPFYWEGPAGGRVLTWFTDWRRSWYAEGLVMGLHKDLAVGMDNLLGYVRQLEAEGYRWRGLAIHAAMDNRFPRPELAEFVRHFNGAGTGVQIAMATNRDFFQYMESEHGGEFAVHRGGWPDWWASGNGSAAYEVACSRRAKASLRRSRALAAQLGAELDGEVAAGALADLLMFDEHTWGHNTSGRDPWGPMARLQWAQKRAYALSGLQRAGRLERDLMAQLGGASASAQEGEDGLVVSNPFDRDSTAVVCLPPQSGGRRAPGLRDADSGDLVAGQRVSAAATPDRPGDYYVIRVPAATRRRFTRVAAAASAPAPGMENDHFRLSYDSATGAVRSIVDRQWGGELLAAGAPWSFGELIHERVARGSRESIYDISHGGASAQARRPRPEFVRQGACARRRRSRLLTGPVFNSLLTSGTLPGVRFRREIRLYHGVHRLDVLLRLDKQVNTEYESLYLAFPFASAPAPEVWVENAGAAYRAGCDQLPGSATDWHSIGEYLAVQGPGWTTVLAPRDVPLVQIGDIHTGKWAPELHLDSGCVYSWITNNLWFTNFPAYQEGQVQLSWSIGAMAGGFDAVLAAQFAHEARVGVVSSALAGSRSVAW